MRARDRLAAARQVATWQAQEKAVTELAAQVQALSRSHRQAQLKQEELTSLQAETLSLAMPGAELKRLREVTESLRTAQARLDAVSTALEFRLQPSAKVQVAGVQVNATDRLTVVERTGIDIEGVGRITVLPGGEGLQSLIADRDQQRKVLAELLQRLGVANLAAAEERERQHVQRAAEASTSSRFP